MSKAIASQILRASLFLAALTVALAAGHSAQAQQEKTKTERLLKTELDPFTADENGWTHMHWAAAANDGEAIRRLLELGGSVAPTALLDESAFSADGRRRAALLGGNMEDWKNEGDTPLFVAAEFDSGIAASVLIANGADASMKLGDGGTPLHTAAYDNAVNVARLLLENGADVNARYDNGTTPLHSAALGDADDAVQLLLKNGADISAKTNTESTPLYNAVWKNSINAAKALLENGAEVNAKRNDDNTPMDRAIHYGHNEMQSLLRQHGGRCNKKC